MYAGDLNAIQDQYADLYNLLQNLGIASIAVGEAGLQIVRYGTGEARVTGSLRTDGILRGGTGLYAGQYTTTGRNSIPSGSRPKGLIIFNTDTNRLEINTGTDTTPSWAPADSVAPITRAILNSAGSSGSWTTPDNARAMLAEVLGPGGKGGTVQTGTSSSPAVGLGGGGGGGGYACSLITSLAANYSYVVGAYLSNTTFGTLAGYRGSDGTGTSAPGIDAPNVAAGGNGGSGVGDIVIPGEAGDYGMAYDPSFRMGGKGGRGGGPYGAGGGQLKWLTGTGNNGTGYGAGGGGACCSYGSGASVYQGGSCGNGLIVLTVIY